MDYIKEFDIRLEKEMYYPGEKLAGQVILNTSENFKLKTIRVVLRGIAHAEWKVIVNGDKRTVQDDQVLIDERHIIWGKDRDVSVPILTRGHHSFPFKFQLPETSLPCSFESKPCTIRYFIKITIDIPYASPPQGTKYFTIIAPHIDCMDENYLKPMGGQDRRAICCWCCKRGVVHLRAYLERTAYCSGESIKLRADINNKSDEVVRLKLKMVQHNEFTIARGVLGVTKETTHKVLEYTGEAIQPRTRHKFDSSNGLFVPPLPPTLHNVCRLLKITYHLKVWVEMEKSGEDLVMQFPLVVATCPFRIPNSSNQPQIDYEACCEHVEGGLYTCPEFQLGQVYDGTVGTDDGETLLLYRPVYVCVKNPNRPRSLSRTDINTVNPSKAGSSGTITGTGNPRKAKSKSKK